MKIRTLRSRRLRDRATAALAAVGAVTLVAGSAVMLTSGTASAGVRPEAPNEHQIAICHATGRDGKYTIAYPSKKQIADDNGHQSGGGVHPGDIIPSFAAGGTGGSAWDAFGGLNFSGDGLAIYDNGCVVPDEDTDPERVTPAYPAAEPPGCGVAGRLVVPASQPAGIVVTSAGGADGDGPGTYTFTYEAANDEYILVGDDEVTVTVHPALESQSTDAEAPCYVRPDEPDEPRTVDLKLTYIVDCDVTTNKWRVRNPSDEAIEVAYGAYPVGASGTLTATPGDSFFTTPYGSETMKISWGDGDTITQASTTKASGGDAENCEAPPMTVRPELTWDDPCGTADDTVDGVAKDGYTFVVDDETGEVAFTAKDGFVLDGPGTLKAPWTDEPCPRYATPTDPEVDESQECEVEGTFSVPDTEGVQYFLDGEPIEPGTYDGPVVGLLTAEPVGHTVLTEDDWEYDLVLDEAEECDEVLPEEVTDEDSDKPAEDSPDEVKGVAQERPHPTGSVAAPTQGGVAPTVLPTSVNAGLGAVAPAPTGPRSGPGLLLAGLGMLLVAGALRFGGRRVRQLS